MVSNFPSKNKVRELQLRIYKKLTKTRIYCDVVIVRESYYRECKDIIGTVAYYANMKGKRLNRKLSKWNARTFHSKPSDVGLWGYPESPNSPAKEQ